MQTGDHTVSYEVSYERSTVEWHYMRKAKASTKCHVVCRFKHNVDAVLQRPIYFPSNDHLNVQFMCLSTLFQFFVLL